MANKLSASLRKAADGLNKTIEAKRNPGVANQNPTARRARIADGMMREAHRLEKVQAILRKLADWNDEGKVPVFMSGIKTRATVETILGFQTLPREGGAFVKERARLINAGLVNDTMLYSVRQAFQRIAEEATAVKPVAVTRAESIRSVERELIGVKIPGYFPTPMPLAQELARMANIQPGMRVLEPSAGNGHICDAIIDAEPTAQVVALELNSRLVDILKLKGYQTIQGDFLSFAGVSGDFDRIVMNPPFEKAQDIKHVQHAYQLLKPGGRLVAIMGEGAFFRTERIATDFRDWLNSLPESNYDKLPEGSFTGKDALRQTGTNTRVVVIDKASDTQKVSDFVGSKDAEEHNQFMRDFVYAD